MYISSGFKTYSYLYKTTEIKHFRPTFYSILRVSYRTKFRWTKFLSDKIFCPTKFSPPSKNFLNFVEAVLLILLSQHSISGQNFCRRNIFVGHNFRHMSKISTILSDEVLSGKVLGFKLR